MPGMVVEVASDALVAPSVIAYSRSCVADVGKVHDEELEQTLRAVDAEPAEHAQLPEMIACYVRLKSKKSHQTRAARASAHIPVAEADGSNARGVAEHRAGDGGC